MTKLVIQETKLSKCLILWLLHEVYKDKVVINQKRGEWKIYFLKKDLTPEIVNHMACKLKMDIISMSSVRGILRY